MDNYDLLYDDSLERLKIEFGEFLKFAEKGKYIKHRGYKARKKSILLRESLKLWRELSLEHEKRLDEFKNKFSKNHKKNDNSTDNSIEIVNDNTEDK